jgi:lipid-binding SYLF domain-containing protein
MGEDDLNYLKTSEGWELGSGPSITVIDQGLAGTISTATARQGVFAFVFEQKGLMGGLSLKGSKITRIHPK